MISLDVLLDKALEAWKALAPSFAAEADVAVEYGHPKIERLSGWPRTRRWRACVLKSTGGTILRDACGENAEAAVRALIAGMVDVAATDAAEADKRLAEARARLAEIKLYAAMKEAP